MPRDDFSERIRAALEGQRGERDDDARRLSASTPLEQLHTLALSAESESVRLRAAQLYLQREDERRERREARPAETLATDELLTDLDDLRAATLSLLLTDPAEAAAFPRTSRLLTDAIERRAQDRLRELTDVRRVEAEIEARARELALHFPSEAAAPLHPVADEAGAPVAARRAGPAARVVFEPPPGLTRDDLRRPWGRGHENVVGLRSVR